MADDAGLINEVLAETSFLYGGNAAFVEDLYAKWAADPISVEPSWRAFFSTLGDRAEEGTRAATLDSLRAIMMIRAFRMRGHLKANLDPLGIATTPGDASELDPATYGFSEAGYRRPVFLDHGLGLGR